MKTNPTFSPSAQRQQGIVLVVALILLIVLTLLGISAMDTTILEHRLAKNNEERARSFQLAEAGLGHGRQVYTSNTWIADIVTRASWSTTPTEIDNNGNTPRPVLSRKIDEQASTVVAGQTWLEFKGVFVNQFSVANQANSNALTQSVYYEVHTTGANLADKTKENGVQSNAIQISLRQGMRQTVPAPQ